MKGEQNQVACLRNKSRLPCSLREGQQKGIKRKVTRNCARSLLSSTRSAAGTSLPHANTVRRRGGHSTSLLFLRVPRSSSSSRGLQLMVSLLTFTRWCSTPSLESAFTARACFSCAVFSAVFLGGRRKGSSRGCFLQRQSTLHGSGEVWRTSRVSGCAETQWEMLRGRGGRAERAKGKAICPLPGKSLLTWICPPQRNHVPGRGCPNLPSPGLS